MVIGSELASHGALKNVDTLANIEYVIGSPFDDTMLGGRETTGLEGGTGNDYLEDPEQGHVVVYNISNDAGHDTISDSDGQGSIHYNNEPIADCSFRPIRTNTAYYYCDSKTLYMLSPNYDSGGGMKLTFDELPDNPSQSVVVERLGSNNPILGIRFGTGEDGLYSIRGGKGKDRVRYVYNEASSVTTTTTTQTLAKRQAETSALPQDVHHDYSDEDDLIELHDFGDLIDRETLNLESFGLNGTKLTLPGREILFPNAQVTSDRFRLTNSVPITAIVLGIIFPLLILGAAYLAFRNREKVFSTGRTIRDLPGDIREIAREHQVTFDEHHPRGAWPEPLPEEATLNDRARHSLDIGKYVARSGARVCIPYVTASYARLRHGNPAPEQRQVEEIEMEERQEAPQHSEGSSSEEKRQEPKHYVRADTTKPQPSEEPSGYCSKIKQKLERKDKEKKTKSGISSSDMRQFLHSNTLGKN